MKVGRTSDLRDHLRTASASFAHEAIVRFQDVDAAGIVFYPRILEYFHDAYVAFLSASGCPLDRVLESGDWAAPIRHAEADFIAPLRFGDVMRIEIVGARVEASEVTIGFRICVGDSVRATGHSVHVFVDRSTFRRAPIPDLPGKALALLNRLPEPS